MHCRLTKKRTLTASLRALQCHVSFIMMIQAHLSSSPGGRGGAARRLTRFKPFISRWSCLASSSSGSTSTILAQQPQDSLSEAIQDCKTHDASLYFWCLVLQRRNLSPSPSPQRDHSSWERDMQDTAIQPFPSYKLGSACRHHPYSA